MQVNTGSDLDLGFGGEKVKGEGVKENVLKAAYRDERAAEQGVVDSQLAMGMRYEKGTGVVRSLPKAAYWYGKAAEQGFVDAQYRLGICYQESIEIDSI